ncbi:hypothetical protein M758_3G186100 [Ceratodon purpureus]|nr:hypothetical protein M758_3G186100 [Ceratodon purpureus]
MRWRGVQQRRSESSDASLSSDGPMAITGKRGLIILFPLLPRITISVAELGTGFTGGRLERTMTCSALPAPARNQGGRRIASTHHAGMWDSDHDDTCRWFCLVPLGSLCLSATGIRDHRHQAPVRTSTLQCLDCIVDARVWIRRWSGSRW